VRSPTWPLAKELELMKALFALHLIRDPAAFSLVWDVDPAASDCKLPPMVLLPLAENAVKHGPAGHRGEIAVRVRSDGELVIFSLENPGAYRGARAGSEGLPIVERRLAVAYGNTVSLDIAAAGRKSRESGSHACSKGSPTSRSAASAPMALGMAVLYKRCTGLWKMLIRHRLTHAVWAPLVHVTRLRHLRYRRLLEEQGVAKGALLSMIRPSV
jgi:hypothetical protein